MGDHKGRPYNYRIIFLSQSFNWPPKVKEV